MPERVTAPTPSPEYPATPTYGAILQTLPAWAKQLDQCNADKRAAADICGPAAVGRVTAP